VPLRLGQTTARLRQSVSHDPLLACSDSSRPNPPTSYITGYIILLKTCYTFTPSRQAWSRFVPVVSAPPPRPWHPRAQRLAEVCQPHIREAAQLYLAQGMPHGLGAIPCTRFPAGFMLVAFNVVISSTWFWTRTASPTSFSIVTTIPPYFLTQTP
jgi:hypothetical protein